MIWDEIKKGYASPLPLSHEERVDSGIATLFFALGIIACVVFAPIAIYWHMRETRQQARQAAKPVIRAPLRPMQTLLMSLPLAADAPVVTELEAPASVFSASHWMVVGNQVYPPERVVELPTDIPITIRFYRSKPASQAAPPDRTNTLIFRRARVGSSPELGAG